MVPQQEILPQLETLCRSVFGHDDVHLAADTTATDVAGWDSLSHVRLIRAVERHFRIKLAVSEVLKLSNVGQLANLISRKAA